MIKVRNVTTDGEVQLQWAGRVTKLYPKKRMARKNNYTMKTSVERPEKRRYDGK